jgi:ribosomal subunit interface protein
MQWELRSHGVELEEGVREHVERRLQFALSRFGSKIGRIVVSLSDLNGPKGGIDKKCQIVVQMRGMSDIIADIVDTGWIVAIDRATNRISHSVSRQMERSRSFERESAAGV